ncbi:hypothetical protein QJS04_geneDACA021543 [Acorus gramineus]|uniref:DUF4378 domain-containing protein n=1 Tax=Acorus gramineus TaxID=55184 RepID=A0AAV9B5Z5_ACOGR|nr:hypothetical protein QJS04_geneDACA021543 [Acorus gramineus]
MAKELHRKHSSGNYENNHPGCLWGIIHLFDSHQRIRPRKMFPNRRRRYGRDTGGVKYGKMKFSEELGLIDAEVDRVVEDKIKPGGRKVDKARMKAPAAKELSKIKQHGKAPPLSPRLQRTYSIHHLECNDYVLPEEWPADSEVPVDIHPFDSSSFISPLHDPPLTISSEYAIHGNCYQAYETSKKATQKGCHQIDEIGRQILEKQIHDQEKLDETEDVLLKQKNSDAKELGSPTINQTKDLLSALELFSAKRKLFLQILNDQNSVLTKSGSFPGAGLSSGKNDVNIGFKNKQKRDECEPNVVPTAIEEGVDHLPSCNFRHEFEIQRGKSSVVNHFKDLKEKLRQVIKESGKAQHRISMDGIIDKIPYGRSTSLKEVESLMHRCDEDKLSGNDVNRKNSVNHIRRSRSLTESMDRYSQLIESTFSREYRSKSVKEDRSSHENYFSNSFGRILYLPDLESYFPSQDGDTKVPHDTLGSHPSSLICMDSRVGVETHPNYQKSDENTSKTFVSVENMEYNLRINVTDTSDEHAYPPIFSDENHVNSERSGSCDGLDGPPLHEEFEEHGIALDVPNDKSQITKYDNEYPCFQVDMKDRANFDYVRDILKKCTWNSPDQPLDRILFEEEEKNSSRHEDYSNSDHQLLFDLINEVLLEISKNSCGYSPSLFSNSYVRPMPVGYHVLEEVWKNISQCFSFQPELVPSLDCIVSRDLKRNDGWKNLRSDIESLVLELEEWMLDDLLDEETLAIVA